MCGNAQHTKKHQQPNNSMIAHEIKTQEREKIMRRESSEIKIPHAADPVRIAQEQARKTDELTGARVHQISQLLRERQATAQVQTVSLRHKIYDPELPVIARAHIEREMNDDFLGCLGFDASSFVRESLFRNRFQKETANKETFLMFMFFFSGAIIKCSFPRKSH